MLIGLTGQIGAGKSTAARILKLFGATVIDADRIGRNVVEQQPSILKKLVRVFGAEILTPSGKLKRKKLAGLAFINESSRRKLNSIVHPPLLKELKKQAKEAEKKYEVVIIDAALLLEWGLDKWVDKTLVIHTSRKRRLKFLERRGISHADAIAREKRQLSFSKYRQRADNLILNSGTKRELQRKLSQYWDRVVLAQ